jgi:hypothetical protein
MPARIEDVDIEGLRSWGSEQLGAGPDPQEGLMSASTRTVQQTLGTRQIGAALVVVGRAIVLAAALAFSQTAVTQTQTAPAAGTAPIFVDHGSRDEMGPGSVIGVDRAYNDYGWKGYTDAAAAAAARAAGSDQVRLNFGSNGPGPRPQ